MVKTRRRGAQMRDARDFDAFYEASRSRTLTYLYAASGDLAEAQDAAQEAYARAWQRWGSLPDNPEAWVRTVGWRILSHGWRRRRSAAKAQRRSGPPVLAPPPGVETVAVVAALRQLPQPQRQAIVLHYLLDLPLAEIAAETATPIGTLKARLSRGRIALAAILGTEAREDDHV
jgi:RNA polymerase sigma-70 factor (ECF subfamily)